MSDGLGAWFRDTPESRQMLSEEELKLVYYIAALDEALARAEKAEAVEDQYNDSRKAVIRLGDERDEALTRAEEERDRRARVLRGWRRAIGDRHEALARAEAAEAERDAALAVIKDVREKIALALVEAYTSPYGPRNPAWDIDGPDDETNPYHLPESVEDRMKQTLSVPFVAGDGHMSIGLPSINEVMAVIDTLLPEVTP